MLRFFIRLVLFTWIFHCIFPLVPGWHYRGSVLHSIPVGFLFTIQGTVIEILCTEFAQLSKCRVQKIYLLLPAWFLGFGLLPAISLKCFTQSPSTDLSFHGWTPAIGGSFLIFLTGTITGGSDFNEILDRKWTKFFSYIINEKK